MKVPFLENLNSKYPEYRLDGKKMQENMIFFFLTILSLFFWSLFSFWELFWEYVLGFFESLEGIQLVRKEDIAKEGFPDVKGGIKKCHRREWKDSLNAKSRQIKTQMAYYYYY